MCARQEVTLTMVHRLPEQFPHHAHYVGGFLPGIFTLALLALLVALAVWGLVVLRRARPTAGPGMQAAPRAEDVALREARMRYARGEITREQFLEISSDLQGT
ncbi:MAG: hypothetical protein ACRDJ4_11360, partial [Actinomycetota bacterium]